MLKEKLELLVERLTDREKIQRVNALDQLKIEVTGATSTMTSVPKPLKFLCPKYAEIKAAFAAETDATLKVCITAFLINGVLQMPKNLT